MSKAKSYYAEAFLEKQLSYYRSLPEKQRRHCLAMEYERLGVGSRRYLSRIFGAARQTIRKGVRELAENKYEGDYTRQRAAGGGRKKRSDHSGIERLDTGIC